MKNEWQEEIEALEIVYKELRPFDRAAQLRMMKWLSERMKADFKEARSRKYGHAHSETASQSMEPK